MEQMLSAGISTLTVHLGCHHLHHIDGPDGHAPVYHGGGGGGDERLVGIAGVGHIVPAESQYHLLIQGVAIFRAGIRLLGRLFLFTVRVLIAVGEVYL